MLDNAQLEALRVRYKAERPVYEVLAGEVKSQLLDAARRDGVACACSGRAKEIDSFLKKALLKSYLDPYEQIRDKGGVRLILAYLDDVPKADALVQRIFDIQDRIDKTSGLDVDRLGYRGIHFEVRLPEPTVREVVGEQWDLQGLICEVQLQTRAQNLWNDASHAFLYKPYQPLPDPVQRRVLRLVALMEIFDDELVRTREAIAEQPGSESAAILEQLEKHFLSLTGRAFNKELSFQVLDLLRDLMSPEEKERFKNLIDEYVDRRCAQFAEMYKDYFNVRDANPLIFQPETILLLERLERDRFALKDRWVEDYPYDLLENLATIWGIDV